MSYILCCLSCLASRQISPLSRVNLILRAVNEEEASPADTVEAVNAGVHREGPAGPSESVGGVPAPFLLQLFQMERGQLFSLNTWDAALGDPGTWNSTCAPCEALALELLIPSGAHRSREHALAGQGEQQARFPVLCLSSQRHWDSRRFPDWPVCFSSMSPRASPYTSTLPSECWAPRWPWSAARTSR